MRGLFRVPLHDDESVLSMWSRLAAANGSDMQRFSLDMGIRDRSVAKGAPAALARAAEVMDVDLPFIQARSMVRLEPKNTFLGGHHFPSYHPLTRVTNRFCPRCLRDDDARNDRFPAARRYFRLQWHVHAVRSCPRHRCLIVSGPEPSNPNLNIDFARYNAEYLRDLRPAEADSISLPFTSFEQYIYDRLAGRKGHGEFLDQISLSLGIDMIEQAGICLRYGKTFNQHSALSQVELHSASEEAFHYFDRGHAGLNECLDLISATETKYNSRVGGGRIYGTLYQKMANRREPSDRLGYDALRIHALRKFKLTDRARVFGPLEDVRYVNVLTWTKENEIHYTTFLKLLARLGREHALTTMSGGGQLVDASVANEVLAFWRGLATSTELERIMGVSRATMLIIQKESLLVPALPREKFKSYGRYSIADVDAFMKKVLPQEPLTDTFGLHPWQNAARLAGLRRGVVLRLLSEGRVLSRGIDTKLPPGINSLLLDPVELQQLVSFESSSTI